MPRIARLLLPLLLFAADASAQSFQLSYGGANLQDAAATVSDATGHSTLVREVFPSGDKVRIRLLRTDLQGQNQQWFDVAMDGACFVQDAVVSGDGNITLCGSRIATGRSDQDALVAKISPTGAVLWAWTSDAPGTQEELMGLQRTDDGGYIACGTWRGTADSDALLVRLDANGNLVWQYHYGTEASEFANSVASGPDGYMVAGRIAGFTGDADAYVLRTDNNGAEQWWQSWGGVKNEWLKGIARSGTAYIMAGYTDSYGPVAGGQHVRSTYLLSMNADGDTLWTRTIGNVGQASTAEDIQLAPNGDLLVAGLAGNNHATDGMVMRLTATGAPIWTRTYDLGGEDVLHQLEVLPDGGFIAAGRSFGQQGAQAVLVRKNSFGN